MENNAAPTASKNEDSSNFKVKAGIFLAGVAGASAIAGFGSTLAATKRRDAKYFNEGIGGHHHHHHHLESPVLLGLRALAWGTFYAVTGCSIIAYGIWKLSGAHDLAEFRCKMGSILPRIPKSENPQGRTEFSGLNDLLDYLQHLKGSKDK